VLLGADQLHHVPVHASEEEHVMLLAFPHGWDEWEYSHGDDFRSPRPVDDEWAVALGVHTLPHQWVPHGGEVRRGSAPCISWLALAWTLVAGQEFGRGQLARLSRGSEPAVVEDCVDGGESEGTDG